MGELERLGDEVARAAADRLHGVLDGAVAGHDDADQVRILLHRGLDKLRPVDARQPQVGDHDVEGETGELLQRRFPGSGLRHVVAVLLQMLRRRFAQRVHVLDEQQMYLFFRHLERSQYFDDRPGRRQAAGILQSAAASADNSSRTATTSLWRVTQ